jgi:alpha-tubulin suppressor-like RCC1 family protein
MVALAQLPSPLLTPGCMPSQTFHTFVAASLFIVSCGGSDAVRPTPAAPKLASVTITAPDSLITGDTASVSAVAYDTDGAAISGATFTWTSADTSIATVDDAGKVIARSYGSVELVAKVTGPAAYLTGVTNAARGNASIGVRLVLATLSAGAYHNCGIARGGVVHCWGEGRWGRLGTGVAYDSWQSITSPVAAVADARFSSVDADDLQDSRSGHTCAVAVDGAAYCWGSGAWGMLGDGQHGEGLPVHMNPAPTRAAGVPTIEQVALGGSHSCLLDTEGGVWCAGANSLEELGAAYAPNGCSVDEPCVPNFLPVQGGLRFRSITAGTHHNCGLTEAGEAWCWGMDVTGQTTRSPAPERVPGGLLFQSIVSGGLSTCGITLDGATYCWGYNYFGEAGIGAPTYGAFVQTPTAVTTPAPLVALTLGVYHACGLTADGIAYCWGSNAAGQLGATTTETCGLAGGQIAPCSSVPIAVNTTLRFTTLAAGYAHTCGAASDGEAYCWGANDHGQLGTGDTAPKTSPAKVISTR